MTAERPITGVVPVMLTPFEAGGGIDWEGYAALIEWYLANGADALFAVCQSSEMQHLTLEERVALAEFAVRAVNGRVPVLASGHVAESFDDQRAELRRMADTGIDVLVMVTNRLA
ncbi:MAG: dihydrodipicolinate synthase family protein, partial [Paracoccaceae bacterium]